MVGNVKQAVRDFIEASFLFREGRDRLADGESLLAAGLIDSTGILELVSFIETEFAIAMEDEEIVPDNLDSVDQIAAYIERKRSPHRPAAIAV
jgi:acyl carrier protein